MSGRMQVRPERISAMIEELGTHITPVGTVFAQNGEIDLSIKDGFVIMDVCEERQAGKDRVVQQRVRLKLLIENTAVLRQLVDCLLLGRRAGRWSETALASMAKEGVA